MFQKNEKKKLFQTAMLKRQRVLLSRRAAQQERLHIGFGAMVLWAIFFGVLVYTLFFSPWLLITTTEIVGESVVPRPLLESFLREELSKEKFFILSNKQLLIFSPSKNQKIWLERFPKMESVLFERLYPETLRVQVTEQPLLVRWCSGGPCVLLGNNGETISDKYSYEPYYEPYIFTIVDKSATPVRSGETLDSSTYLQTVQGLYEQFTQITGLSMSPTFETPTQHAYELRIKTNEGWDILLNTQTFTSETLETLMLVLQEKVPDEKRSSLLTIDLRTEGRAFIAYKNEPVEEAMAPDDLIPKEEERQMQEKEAKKKN